jgi:prepilin-type N-terminal cleavage/methylation domain-containing protein
MGTIKNRYLHAGFTIVEVLLVIVVIGILATITIVSFNGAQKRGWDSSVQSDLDAISGLLEGSRVRSTPQEFPRTKAVLDTLNIKASKAAYDTTITYNMIYCIANTGANAYQEFLLVAKSRSGTIFAMTQDGFKANTYTQANLTANFCSDQGMGLVSNGLYAANTWQTWVQN